GNSLYGTAPEGGSLGVGTVFAVNTDATGFTNLHSFTLGDGAFPYAALILSSNTVYGTTAGNSGTAGYGTVFAVNTDATGFTNLHRFTPLSAPFQLGGNNSDGANPFGGLILSGNTLFGTAAYG